MTKPISVLRRHMIEDMKMRNMSPNSQKVYVAAVANFAAFHGQSPDKLGVEHVRQYRLHLMGRGLKASSINPIIGGLRFFYGTTLRRREMLDDMPYARLEDTLPAVLSPEEVARVLGAVANRKHRAVFATIYAAGLRVSEAAALKVGDIDSQRMVIHIRQGKGGKDRFVMLSEQLLGILRAYWRAERPQEWLFPGVDPGRPITPRGLQYACRAAAEAAGLDKKVTVHTLRHCFATHLLEQGVDIRVIQDLLGSAPSRLPRVGRSACTQSEPVITPAWSNGSIGSAFG